MSDDPVSVVSGNGLGAQDRRAELGAAISGAKIDDDQITFLVFG
jgi:hypothetical protein